MDPVIIRDEEKYELLNPKIGWRADMVAVQEKIALRCSGRFLAACF
jgi:hypothetical protein